MTRVEIVAIAIRLLALWMMFTAATLFSITVVTFLGPGDAVPRAAMASVTVSVALLVFGFMTWKLSVWLASGLLPRPTSDEAVAAWGARDLERVAFRVLGLYLVATALGGATEAAIGSRVATGLPRTSDSCTRRSWAEARCSFSSGWRSSWARVG